MEIDGVGIAALISFVALLGAWIVLPGSPKPLQGRPAPSVRVSEPSGAD